MRQFIIVIGLPKSGKNEYILKSFDNGSYFLIDGESFINKPTVNEKISYEAIENSRIQCLEHVKHIFKEYFGEDKQETKEELEQIKEQQEETEQIEQQEETEQIKQQDTVEYKDIILSLYSSTPGKWIEFIELAIKYDYNIKFVKPTDHHFYYKSKFSDSKMQMRYLSNLFKNKMQLIKSVDYDDKGNSFVRETDLFRRLVLEFESSLSFVLNAKNIGDNEEILKVINKKYGDIVKKQKNISDKTKTALELMEKKEKEKEEKRLLSINNKNLKKKNRSKMMSDEDFTDEFYSDAKFKDMDLKTDGEENNEPDAFENVVFSKNRKQRMKEQKENARIQNAEKIAKESTEVVDESTKVVEEVSM